ncbi:MAG: AAA family ATPase, partial [Chloroflexota bacterium]|nr:AAA family ATPase [Chloroflexota bacterium]
MNDLTLSFLGTFQVTLDGHTITHFRSDKVRALLAYLAVEADRPHDRSYLAGLLWPEMPEAAARRNLTQTLVRLRRTVRDEQAMPPFFLVTRQHLQFNLDSACRLDVADFTRLLEHEPVIADRERAVALYKGELLPGFSLPDCEAFDEWLLLKREYLQRLALEALDALTNAYLEIGNYRRAERYARWQLALDPWREAAYRQLMRALAYSGQRSAALAQYESCRQVLDEEVGMEPSPATTALYRRIRASPSGRQHTLPAQLTSFVGREAELAEVMRLLHDPTSRLLTVVGPGGIGKTRLALQAAEQTRTHYLHGVYFVSLASLSAPDLLLPVLANALDVMLQGQEEPKVQVLNYLHDKELLLLLDNVEHLLPGAALLIAELLTAVPHLHLLVTSREALHLYGEREYPVPPLGLPDLQHLPPVEELSHVPAVALFVQRTRAVKPDFALTDENARAVAELCVQLDGLPLALELAAARSKMLSPQAMVARLDRRFSLLTGGARDRPPRQQTLRNTIDWSYDLLKAGEQKLFNRLAVFVGGCSLDAIEAVCTRGDRLIDPFEGIASLLNKSLLRQEA